MSELSERDFDAHICGKLFKEACKDLGIRLNKWYFGEWRVYEYSDSSMNNGRIFYNSLKLEDHLLWCDFKYADNHWLIDTIQITQD